MKESEKDEEEVEERKDERGREVEGNKGET